LRIVNLRVTHKKASIPVLEALVFKDLPKALKEICTLEGVNESVIIQTCNRVEIFAVVPTEHWLTAGAEMAEYWRRRAGFNFEHFYDILEKNFNSEALTHLLRLASGLESMIVGEDQILGQVQDAFNEAKENGTVGPILERSFDKAIKVGRDVRTETNVSKGTVSVGSAAVGLAEEILGELKDKKIIIIGAGETGELVGKALADREHAVIFVANRTYKRGIELAKVLGGQAVKFDRVNEFLTDVDLAIVATAAPHSVITRDLMNRVLEERKGKKLLIIDLSQPRNVDKDVSSLPTVELRNIDDLRGIAQSNLEMRLEEVGKAEEIIQDELKSLELMLQREQAEPIISAIWSSAEEIRRRELTKALKMIGNLDNEQHRIIDDLTQVLVKRILHHPVENLRKAAEKGKTNVISTVRELFNVKQVKGEKIDVSSASNEETQKDTEN
jgi:glutamyl-tRNA reductase